MFKNHFNTYKDYVKNFKRACPKYGIRQTKYSPIGHPPADIIQYKNLVEKFESPIIVDFGGNVDTHYDMLIDLKTKSDLSHYNIVEVYDIFKQNKHRQNPKFYTNVRQIKHTIDIFYSNGGIQYCYRPERLFLYINDILKPKYVFLQRVHITDNPSYITSQMPYGEICYWLFNINFFDQYLTDYTKEILETQIKGGMTGGYGEPIFYYNLLFTRL